MLPEHSGHRSSFPMRLTAEPLVFVGSQLHGHTQCTRQGALSPRSTSFRNVRVISRPKRSSTLHFDIGVLFPAPSASSASPVRALSASVFIGRICYAVQAGSCIIGFFSTRNVISPLSDI